MDSKTTLFSQSDGTAAIKELCPGAFPVCRTPGAFSFGASETPAAFTFPLERAILFEFPPAAGRDTGAEMATANGRETMAKRNRACKVNKYFPPRMNSGAPVAPVAPAVASNMPTASFMLSNSPLAARGII